MILCDLLLCYKEPSLGLVVDGPFRFEKSQPRTRIYFAEVLYNLARTIDAGRSGASVRLVRCSSQNRDGFNGNWFVVVERSTDGIHVREGIGGPLRAVKLSIRSVCSIRDAILEPARRWVSEACLCLRDIWW